MRPLAVSHKIQAKPVEFSFPPSPSSAAAQEPLTCSPEHMPKYEMSLWACSNGRGGVV